MEKLLNEENTWDKDTTCDKVEGPCELFTKDDIRKALRKMNKGKAAGPGKQPLKRCVCVCI